MNRKVAEQHRHAQAVADLFSHSHNAAAADLESGFAGMAKRIDAILQGARRDDLAVGNASRRGLNDAETAHAPIFSPAPSAT